MITDRQEKGHFAKGNKLAVNNAGPLASRKNMCTKVLISQLNEMSKNDKGKPLDISRLHVVCDALIKKAEKGDVAAAHEIFDRVQGKAPQTTDVVETHNVNVAMIVRSMPLKEAMDLYSQVAVERPKVLTIEHDDNE